MMRTALSCLEGVGGGHPDLFFLLGYIPSTSGLGLLEEVQAGGLSCTLIPVPRIPSAVAVQEAEWTVATRAQLWTLGGLEDL